MNLKIAILFLLLPLFIIGCTPKVAKDISASSTTEARLQAVLQKIYTEHPNVIGLMAHVEAPDLGISWSGAVGQSKKGKKGINTNQPVWIASNTKTYVAATILRLVEQGKLELYQTIDQYLTEKTKSLLISDGYELDKIAIANLLSHTSGIFDYVSADAFFARIDTDPMHRWTRDEQIALAISDGEPLGKAGERFSYADVNYSLLTEIIEQITKQPYYTAIRNLLNYEKHGLNDTWFISQEDRPKGTPPCAYQYSEDVKINTYELDPSFDLYGGGGIAATAKDLAMFSQLLFNKKLFDQPETLELIFTKVKTVDPVPNDYSLGLSESEVNGLQTFGHGGFWGTVVNYLPKYNASVSVFVLERKERALRKDLLEGLIGEIERVGR